MKKWTLLLAPGLLAAACGDDDYIPGAIEPEKPAPEPYDFVIGSLFGFESPVRKGAITANPNTTYYNYPLFTGTEEEWWDNLVEEFAHSGMDYAMANCRGLQPTEARYNDHGDPRRLTQMVAAMERRGVADKFKIAIFDDCPASWAAARNLDLYGEYTPAINGKYDYPLDNLDGDGGIYKYIWDYNIKLAFRNVPDSYRLKFDGRPVLFLWSVNNFLDPGGTNNYARKLSPILKRLREDFVAEFKVDPFIVVDRAFNDRDASVEYPIVDGINNWFGMSDPYTTRTVGDVTIGVAVPGFSINDKTSNPMFIDANHGQRLITSLQKTADARSRIVLIEGFTDLYENAALWRSTDTKFYDYPNQRLNILRRFGNDPYPADFKIEAEGCDYYEDNTTGNSGGAFRKGDLDVAKCTDTYAGWHVAGASAGEWLRWKELPLRAATTTFRIRYASTVASEVVFNVDDKDGATIRLASTGGAWRTADAGTVGFDREGLHDITLKVASGTLDINYFNMTAAE